MKKTRRQKTEEKANYRKHLIKTGYLNTDSQRNYEPKTIVSAKIQHTFFKGIYYLKFKHQIVYVGMSTTNCMNRINTHWNDNNKIFDAFEIKPTPDLSNKQILALEKRLIKKYKPMFNKVHNKDNNR
jgi:excinuclease UvrABC nuclease subunit